VRNTSSALAMLLERLEIIATTYHSTIFKTHVFSLYSNLCIYGSIYIRYIWTNGGGLGGLVALVPSMGQREAGGNDFA